MALTQTGSIIAGVLVGALVLVACAWGVVRWRRGNDNLQRLLKAIGGEVISNCFIPDGTGEEIHIDHLLLTPYGLILLDIKDVQGMVFAGELMDSWSATHTGARITFDNPIPALQARTAALALLAPGVPIEARVLFINDVEFPKGHPDRVVTVASLLEEYRACAAGAPSDDYGARWQEIKQVVSR